MSCLQEDLGVVGVPDLGSEGTIANGGALSSLPLMVSDNPETVSGASGTLWQHSLASASGAITSRLFLWHVNGSGSSKKLGVTVENTGDTPLKISSVKRQTGTGGDYLEIGKCNAKALLGATLDNHTPVDAGDIAAGSVGLVEEFSWNSGAFRGAQYEITVATSSGSGNVSYILRTVWGATTSNLRTFKASPVALVGTHPRGSWPASEITVDLIWGTGPTAPPVTQSYRLANRVHDFICKAADSELPNLASDNPANFGSICRKINLKLQNMSMEDVTVAVYVNPRGGAFAGSVRASTMLPGARGIPKLNAPGDAVRLGTIVSPKQTQKTEEIELVVAGGSATPLLIIVVPL